MRANVIQQLFHRPLGEHDMAVHAQHPVPLREVEHHVAHCRAVLLVIRLVAHIRDAVGKALQMLGGGAFRVVIQNQHLAFGHRLGMVEQQRGDRKIHPVVVIIGGHRDRQRIAFARRFVDCGRAGGLTADHPVSHPLQDALGGIARANGFYLGRVFGP